MVSSTDSEDNNILYNWDKGDEYAENHNVFVLVLQYSSSTVVLRPEFLEEMPVFCKVHSGDGFVLWVFKG